MITTRPSAQTTSKTGNQFPQSYNIGDEVVFIPASQVSQIILAQGVTCKVVGVTFERGKVLYDLAVPINSFDFYEEYPLMRVDSIFVFDKPRLLLRLGP